MPAWYCRGREFLHDSPTETISEFRSECHRDSVQIVNMVPKLLGESSTIEVFVGDCGKHRGGFHWNYFDLRMAAGNHVLLCRMDGLLCIYTFGNKAILGEDVETRELSA